ncbi:MAG: hypothetical protein ACFFDP_05380 [Promethearchaeota archaeon]
MPDIRDKLLTLDRKGLEEEARRLGLSVKSTMSRAELITLIEKETALQEFGELQPFSEYRFLIIGLFFVTIASFILALQTLFVLQLGNDNLFGVILVPIYLVFRGLGGFLLSSALFSLGLKTGYRTITPVMRASFILGAVLVLIIVLVWLPLPASWNVS